MDVLFILDATASMRWGKGTLEHDVERDKALHEVERGHGTA